MTARLSVLISFWHCRETDRQTLLLQNGSGGGREWASLCSRGRASLPACGHSGRERLGFREPLPCSRLNKDYSKGLLGGVGM